MKNSPTLCQLFVDSALQPLRKLWPNTVIYHYMDDILFSQQTPFTDAQLQQIEAVLKQRSLIIAPEKIQRAAPWKYLGWTITKSIITPQKLQLNTNIRTLHDAQRLLGDLQWLRPVVGFPNELLTPLRPLLRGTDPAHPILLTDEQQVALQRLLDCVTRGQVHRRRLDLPIDLTIWFGAQHLLGALTQSKKKTGEEWVLEWMGLLPPSR